MKDAIVFLLIALSFTAATQAQIYGKPVPAIRTNDTLHPHTLTLADTIRVRDSVRVDDLVAPATIAKLPTSGAATFNEDSLTVDFSASATNTAFAIFQLSHATVQDTAYDLDIHVHWPQEDTGTVVWNTIYSVSNTGGGTSAFTVSSRRVLDFAYDGKQLHQITSVALIPSESVGPSTIIRVKLQRLGGDAQDTYPLAVRVRSIDVHYWRHVEGGSKYEFSRY